jgi:hypothetical protein
MEPPRNWWQAFEGVMSGVATFLRAVASLISIVKQTGRRARRRTPKGAHGTQGKRCRVRRAEGCRRNSRVYGRRTERSRRRSRS